MKRLFVFPAAILIAASSFAQLSPRYASWADGPEKLLMTREELKQWKAIQSDADAQAFIDLFWAKRDPTPTTPLNEFHQAFDQRVAYADNEFSNGHEPGSLTDKGKVLILLGTPYSIGGRAGEPSTPAPVGPAMVVPTDSQGQLALPNPVRESNREVWTYAHDHKPRFIPQSDFVLMFLDEGHNDWRLANTERDNADYILHEAVTGLIFSPKLTKAPFSSAGFRAHSAMFRDLVLETAYKDFRSSGKSSVGPANLTWGAFLSPAGEHFISAQLYTPAASGIASGQSIDFFSVIENSAGEFVDVDETPSTMIAIGSDAYIDKTVSLEPGTYNATFGLASQSKILSATRVPITIEKMDPGLPAISPLLLSASVQPLKTAFAPTDPFTFGGFKVIPKGDAVFENKGDLWYFLELRNPGIAEGAPKIRMSIDVEGQTATGPAEMKFPLTEVKALKLRGSENRYALGMSVPLDGFVPGQYTFKIHVEDAVLSKSYDAEKPFRVRPPS